MKKVTILVTFLLMFSFIVSAQSVDEAFNKGLEQFKAKQYEEAIKNFSFVTTKSPNEYNAFYNIGLCYYNLKQYNQAVSSFRQATNIKPDFTRAWFYLGDSLQLTNRSDEAVTAFEKAISLDDKNGAYFYGLGLAQRNLKDYNAALNAFKKFAELSPNSHLAFTEIGNASVNLRLFPEAIVAFNKAISLKPDHANAVLGLGNAYYNNKNYEQSIPHYLKATQLIPDWATAHLYLADAYLNSTKYSLAVTSYKKAISLDDKLTEAYYGLGLTYHNLKNPTLAKAQLTILQGLDEARAKTLAEKINASTVAVKPTPTPKPTVKTPQRIKDETDVANMPDFGFDGAVVVQVSSIRETPKTLGKVLLSVKRGDILSLTSREANGNFYQVIEEKSGIEGWIDGNAVVIKLTGNTANVGPALEEADADTANANPQVSISNLEEKTTLSIKINGTLYKILPQTTKVITLQAGKMTYYGWSPGIRPARGSSMLVKGKKYSWQFRIYRR